MVDWTLDFKEENGSEGEFEYLDPRKLHFEKAGDTLRLTIEDDRSYLKVHSVRAFPLSVLNEYIGFLDAISGKEIGMIRSLRDLDGRTRQLIQADLYRRYFIPKIARITKAKKEFGTVYWEVETDRGTRQIVIRGIRDSIREIEPGRYMVNDVDGSRFEIPQLSEFDARSLANWDRIY